MSRLRPCAGIVLLALLALGIAGDAGATLATGACCAGMPADHAASESEMPCRSLAPTSCCEASAAGRVPGPASAPVLPAGGIAGPAAAPLPIAWIERSADAPLRNPVATIVLRL
jgi:hypothetical protein